MSCQHRRSYQVGYKLVAVHSPVHCIYSAAPLGEDKAAGTMTQSHYPYTVLTSPYATLLKPCVRLGSDKCKFLIHWFDATGNQTTDLSLEKPALYPIGHRI